MPIHPYPPLPSYEPDCGQDRFAWILQAAARVRYQRQEIDQARWERWDTEKRALRAAEAAKNG